MSNEKNAFHEIRNRTQRFLLSGLSASLGLSGPGFGLDWARDTLDGETLARFARFMSRAGDIADSGEVTRDDLTALNGERDAAARNLNLKKEVVKGVCALMDEVLWAVFARYCVGRDLGRNPAAALLDFESEMLEDALDMLSQFKERLAGEPDDFRLLRDLKESFDFDTDYEEFNEDAINEFTVLLTLIESAVGMARKIDGLHRV